MSSTPDRDNPAAMADSDGASASGISIDADAIAALILDQDGIIRHASTTALKLLDRERDDLIGHPVARLHQTPDIAQAILRRVHDGEVIRNEEVELRRANGRRCVVQVSTSIPDPDTTGERIQWVLHDITDERLADERDACLKAIVQDSDDAIITKRMDGIITSWNPAAVRLYGYSAEEAIGRPVTLIMPPDMPNEFPGIMNRLARGEHIDHYETIRRTRSGRLIDVSVSIAPMRDRTGRIVGASAITRNITDIRLLQRKQREFLTMVAHDLRSPLTSIKGFAQLMQRREAYSATGIAAILNQIRHVERLVGDVLELTRLDENRHDLIVAPVDLAALVQSTIDRAQLLQPTDRISLQVPDEELTGIWDAERLVQVLDNVLSNAVKYAPTGAIEITLRHLADRAEIIVQDHGQGIAADHLPRIFDRFYRAPGEQTASRGVGLGLAITKALVEAHGGTIEATSIPAAGTRVVITLPWDSTPPAGD